MKLESPATLPGLHSNDSTVLTLVSSHWTVLLETNIQIHLSSAAL